MVFAGVALVLASSVGFAVVLAQAGRKVPVLAVARPVPAGAVLAAADLRQVRLGVDDAGAQVVRAAQEDAVVGKTAVVPLVPGSLLSPQQVGGRVAYPPAGKARVAFAVEPGGLPAGVEAGQRVAVFPGAQAGGGAEQPGQEATSALVGTVTDVAEGDRESAPSVVTVLVDTAAAVRAARIDKPHLVVLSPSGQEVP